MHKNWEINTEVPTPNYVQLQNNNNWPNTKVIASPPFSSYRNYQKAENSWAMAGAGGIVTVTQGNQNINLFHHIMTLVLNVLNLNERQRFELTEIQKLSATTDPHDVFTHQGSCE